MTDGDPIVDTYSRLADDYDSERNVGSCWGLAAREAFTSISLKSSYNCVVDLGCGTGNALLQLASDAPPNIRFVGVEPAENMRHIAERHNSQYPNVKILDGRFEEIPLSSNSVDYLYSIMAFHWVTDLDRSVNELHRVLKTTGEADLFFIGRWNGREFIKKTTPIFLKYMGPARLLQAAKLRKQLSREEAADLFRSRFTNSQVSVEESYHTYYDSLEGHWGWWVRIEGQFLNIPPEKRASCERDVKAGLKELETTNGIPYTLHQLRVSIKPTSHLDT